MEEFLDGKLKGWGIEDPELFWAEKSLEKTEELLEFKKLELSKISRDKGGGLGGGVSGREKMKVESGREGT